MSTIPKSEPLFEAEVRSALFHEDRGSVVLRVGAFANRCHQGDRVMVYPVVAESETPTEDK